MKLELEGATEKLQDGFINGLLDLFECWAYYFRASNPDLMPIFNNEEVAESLLQQYIHSADNSIFEYIKIDKNVLIQTKIIPSLPRITYVNQDKISEEEFKIANEFKATAATTVFPRIQEISATLLKKNTNNLNIEVAIQRSEDLIKNRKTIKIHLEAAEAIEREESVKPKILIKLSNNHIGKTILKTKKTKRITHLFYLQPLHSP